MFVYKESEPERLPLAQGDRDTENESELESMSDDEYTERKPRSTLRRVCSSNIPWIFTTIALSLYILTSSPAPQNKNVPWSPTDVG
jgi:hypothetical protein